VDRDDGTLHINEIVLTQLFFCPFQSKIVPHHNAVPQTQPLFLAQGPRSKAFRPSQAHLGGLARGISQCLDGSFDSSRHLGVLVTCQ